MDGLGWRNEPTPLPSSNLVSCSLSMLSASNASSSSLNSMGRATAVSVCRKIMLSDTQFSCCVPAVTTLTLPCRSKV